jgi:hypothetical protein
VNVTPSVDVIPLDDLRTHEVPRGYDDDRNTTGWLTLQRPGPHRYHECWCVPTLEPRIEPDGQLSTIYIHNAMDRREVHE